jgi:8-oxo-dGTP pyrophosphatase MutT (NUDIX family)
MKRVVPKLSASLLLVDRSAHEPRFLFGRRHASHVFMPNRYVFPGGRVDAGDGQVSSPSALHSADHAIIGKHLQARDRATGADAVALCALREAWEESGHMIGTPHAFEAPSPAWSAFAEQRQAPSLESLRLIARAVTPSTYERRYDAWFFMVFRDQIAHSIDVCGPDSELDHQVWASAEETAAFDLPSITRTILTEAVVRLKADPDLSQDAKVPMFHFRGNRFYRKELGA